MEKSKYPFVSVIIPVFNDGERLQLCLAVLAQQTYGRSHFEIIVIDNGSEDFDLVQTAVAPYDNVMLIFEPTPGSYAARNKGLALAQGDIIAFTDADCIPASDWLAQGVEQLQSTPNCGQVIGPIEIFLTNPHRPTPVELYESITGFPQERLLKQGRGGVTANLFTWRSVLDVVGHFDAQLKSGGDVEWGQRVYTKGYKQVYGKSVLVQHPARSSFAELFQRTRRIAGGNYDIQMKRASSSWKRQMVFLQVLFQNLIPPVFFVVNTFRNDQLKSIWQKLQVSSVMVLVRYISAWETLRLKLGGSSSRI
jgi:glycosyltransferase involved in cell wall biosynthesis